MPQSDGDVRQRFGRACQLARCMQHALLVDKVRRADPHDPFHGSADMWMRLSGLGDETSGPLPENRRVACCGHCIGQPIGAGCVRDRFQQIGAERQQERLDRESVQGCPFEPHRTAWFNPISALVSRCSVCTSSAQNN